MKLRTIVKIAIASSVVLLCAGFALYSFFRLSAAESQRKFNLYTLVPPSASAVFATDDAAELVTEVEELTCSKNQQYLHVSKLFSYLKQYINMIAEETPHGLSRQMNQVLISFHEPDNDYNQVLYCSLALEDCGWIEKFVQQYIASTYPSKTFDYKGEDIRIYPLSNGDFLSCYLSSDFLVLSFQKKLIEEVIDAQQSEMSLAADPAFSKINRPKKSNSTTTVYTQMDGMIGWTEFELKLKKDFIYFSGTSQDVDTCFAFVNALRKQKLVKGFSGEMLPSTTFYFTKQDISDWSFLLSLAEKKEKTTMANVDIIQLCNKNLARYLIENTEHDLLACLFQRKDTLQAPAAVMSFSVTDAVEAERMLRSFIDTTPMEKSLNQKKRISFHYTPNRAYPIYTLPRTTLFSRLTNIIAPFSTIYAIFYGGRLLLAPDVDSLLNYIRQMDAGEILNDALGYQAGTDGLSDSYHFMLMADFEQLFHPSVHTARLVPEFFSRNADFFQHFVLFAQFTYADGMVYPNVVLRYKTE